MYHRKNFYKNSIYNSNNDNTREGQLVFHPSQTSTTTQLIDYV